MVAKKNKESFYADTLNSLAKIDREFHWYKAYSWYSDFPIEVVFTKCLRASGLLNDGCVPDFFFMLDLVL